MSRAPESHNRRAARTTLKPIERAAFEVMERELDLLPQRTWLNLSDKIARTAVVLLDADFDFGKIVTESDVQDHKGNINAKAVLTCLKNMAESARKDGVKAQILYLAQHFEKTMKDLHLLKEGDPNGPEEEKTE